MPPRSSPGNGRSPVHRCASMRWTERARRRARSSRGVTVQGAPPSPCRSRAAASPRSSATRPTPARPGVDGQAPAAPGPRQGARPRPRRPLGNAVDLGYARSRRPVAPVSERKRGRQRARRRGGGAAGARPHAGQPRPARPVVPRRAPASRATGMWSELKGEAAIEDPEERAAIMGRTREAAQEPVPSAARLKAAPRRAEVVVRDCGGRSGCCCSSRPRSSTRARAPTTARATRSAPRPCRRRAGSCGSRSRTRPRSSRRARARDATAEVARLDAELAALRAADDDASAARAPRPSSGRAAAARARVAEPSSGRARARGGRPARAPSARTHTHTHTTHTHTRARAPLAAGLAACRGARDRRARRGRRGRAARARRRDLAGCRARSRARGAAAAAAHAVEVASPGAPSASCARATGALVPRRSRAASSSRATSRGTRARTRAAATATRVLAPHARRDGARGYGYYVAGAVGGFRARARARLDRLHES